MQKIFMCPQTSAGETASELQINKRQGMWLQHPPAPPHFLEGEEVAFLLSLLSSEL